MMHAFPMITSWASYIPSWSYVGGCVATLESRRALAVEGIVMESRRAGFYYKHVVITGVPIRNGLAWTAWLK